MQGLSKKGFPDATAHHRQIRRFVLYLLVPLAIFLLLMEEASWETYCYAAHQQRLSPKGEMAVDGFPLQFSELLKAATAPLDVNKAALRQDRNRRWRQRQRRRQLGLKEMLADEATAPPVPATHIPKVIYQTYNLLDAVPPKVARNLAQYAPDYRRYLFDDDDCVAFLGAHYHPDVVKTFHLLRGAHKADLFRYALLYVKGGVYLDIKTELVRPLNTVFNHTADRRVTYTVIDYLNATIYQGMLASPKGNPLFLHGVLDFVRARKPIALYMMSTTHMYHMIRFDTGQVVLHEGLNAVVGGVDGESNLDCEVDYDRMTWETRGAAAPPSATTCARTDGKHGGGSPTRHPRFEYYLFKERRVYVRNCHDGFDKWGMCVFIFDGEDKVVKSRYADFPWLPGPTPWYTQMSRWGYLRFIRWPRVDFTQMNTGVCHVLGW
jgi:hypothetical protein